MGSRVSFLRKVENKSPEIVKEGVMIPLAAVAIKDNQSVVQALEGSKIKLTKVEVAEETANYARVIDGLKPGVTVVAIFDNELENNQQVIIK
jgi:hypothetical protein